MVVRLADVRLPTELWDALDGEPEAFVARLLSAGPLSRPERKCLAFWFKNGRRPPRRGKGRREVIWMGGGRWDSAGLAASRFQRLWAFFRRKGWHLKKAGKFHCRQDRLMHAIADRHGVLVQSLENLVKRKNGMRVNQRSLFDHWIEYLENRRKK